MTGTESSTGAGADQLTLAVLSAQEELEGLLFTSLGGADAAGQREMSLDQPPTRLFLASGEDLTQAVASADAVLLLVRFMDALTMDRLKGIHAQLPQDPAKPMAVLLFREPDEIDFKMSCPACGQKLWVRDTDEGKRGRCPNCKTAFHLPSQPQHAKTELSLTGEVPVTRVVGKDVRSCRNALDNLRGHLTGTSAGATFEPDVLIRRTAKIPVPDSVKGSGGEAGAQ